MILFLFFLYLFFVGIAYGLQDDKAKKYSDKEILVVRCLFWPISLPIYLGDLVIKKFKKKNNETKQH